MSRPKSEATLQKERDREIRKQRREWKRRERERRKAERDERRKRRESARHGGQILVLPAAEIDPSFRTLRSYHPLRFCESCCRIMRDDWMKTEDLCLGCYNDKGGAIRKLRTDRARVSRNRAAVAAAPLPDLAWGPLAESEPSGDPDPTLPPSI